MAGRQLLTVDFDFFSRIPASIDGQHEERPYYREHAWRRVEPSKDTLDPRSRIFWKMMERRFDLRGARLVVSDSHMYALHTFIDVRADGVISFDAHHDLGYGHSDFASMIKRERFDCGSWLWWLLHYRPKLKLDLVFPQWKRSRDLEPDREQSWMSGVLDRTVVRVWPDLPSGGRVTTIHLCRSAAWTPPWLDEAWLAFVMQAQRVTGHRPEFPYVRMEKYHPMHVRGCCAVASRTV